LSVVEGFCFCFVFVGNEVVFTDIATVCPAFLAFSFIVFFILVAPFVAVISAMFSFAAITFTSDPSSF
jgi:hypothetical protein